MTKAITIDKLLVLSALLVFVVLSGISCGGGGGGSSPSSQISSYRTAVAVYIGQTRSMSSRAQGKFVSQASAIPAAVASIRLTVTAPDMNPVQQIVDVAGRSSITLSFQLQNGQNRDFVAEALDSSGIVLYRGETFANLDGTPLQLTIVMISEDPLPPVFAGLSSITDITDTSMQLSWSPATDEVTPQEQIVYLIFLSTTTSQSAQKTGMSAAPSYVTAPGATSFTLISLTPDTEYQVRVEAVDQRGNQTNTNVILTARTKPAPDTVPPTFGGLVSATAQSESEIALTWSAASDNVTVPSQIDYLIYMSVTPGITPGEGAFTTPKTVVTGLVSTTIAGLDPNTTYYFLVRARDKAGNVDSGNVEKSATTLKPPDQTPPTFPNGLGLSVQVTSPTQVIILWNAASDDQTDASNLTYIIYKSSTHDGVYLPSSLFLTLLPGQWKTSLSKLSALLRMQASTISYTVNNLTPNTDNCFGVNARDQAGNTTNNTETTCVHTPSIPDTTPPSVPTGLTVTAVSTSQVNLSWTASPESDVAGYKIYRKDKLPAAIQSVSGTSASDTGLNASTEYCYSVSAVDAASNESARSAEACATTKTPPDTTPPSVPTGLAATAVSSSQINLSWNASTDNVGVVGYKVYRNGQVVASSKKSNAVAIAAITATNYADAGLAPSTRYCYQVSAYDAVPNESALSNQACATTQAPPTTPDTTPPTTPTGLLAQPFTPSKILLSWNPSTDNVAVAGYKIYRDGILITQYAFTSDSMIFFYNVNLSPSTQYCYRVSAYDAANNESGLSNQACATTAAESIVDLYVSSVYDSCPPDGCLSFTVSNGGTLGATNVEVYMIYMGEGIGCNYYPLGSVGAGSSVSQDTYWYLGSYYIMIDPFNTAIPQETPFYKLNNTSCGGNFCTNPPTSQDINCYCLGLGCP